MNKFKFFEINNEDQMKSIFKDINFNITYLKNKIKSYKSSLEKKQMDINDEELELYNQELRKYQRLDEKHDPEKTILDNPEFFKEMIKLMDTKIKKSVEISKKIDKEKRICDIEIINLNIMNHKLKKLNKKFKEEKIWNH